jgi:hypothetical protein
MRWGRIIVAAVLAEVAAVAAVVLAVALFGPDTQEAAEAYAMKIARWLGPVAGACATFAGAIIVAKGAPDRALAHGVAVGCCIALIDAALLVGGGATFEWLFVASDAGRIAAGALGGWVVHSYMPMST